MEGILTMSQREVDRLSIITQVLNKKITPSESASLLKLSERQIFRLVQRVRKEGSKGIIHKHRGKKSNRGYPEKLKQRVLELFLIIREIRGKFFPYFGRMPKCLQFIRY